MVEKSFVARWLRRKQEARRVAMRAWEKPAALQNTPMPEKGIDPAIEAAPSGESIDLRAIDLAQPGAVRAALAAGIPEQARRTALRQAWLSDPMIRNFIGLSENSWDFTVPGAVPGFGVLSTEEAQQLLARATGTSSEGGMPERAAPVGTEPLQRDLGISTASSTVRQTPPIEPAGERTTDRSENDSAVHQERAGSEEHQIIRTRHHGSALPK